RVINGHAARGFLRPTCFLLRRGGHASVAAWGAHRESHLQRAPRCWATDLPARNAVPPPPSPPDRCCKFDAASHDLQRPTDSLASTRAHGKKWTGTAGYSRLEHEVTYIVDPVRHFLRAMVAPASMTGHCGVPISLPLR